MKTKHETECSRFTKLLRKMQKEQKKNPNKYKIIFPKVAK